jgi:hypothetical protein
MRSSLNIRPCAVVMALSLSGCFAVADVDRFHVGTDPLGKGDAAAPGAADQYVNFQLTLIGMKPHLMQLFEYRIIDPNNFIQARGIVDPLGSADVKIYMPLAIPPAGGPFHLDFYGDVNGSGGYDGLGAVCCADHAWRIDPLDAPVDGLTQVTFTHNTTFTDINTFVGMPGVSKDTGFAATIQVVNAAGLSGDLIQTRVVAPGARTVGLYRVPAITQPGFTMVIPGVIEQNNDYEVWVYVDKNANGVYDNPSTGGADLGWKLMGSSDATGLTVRLDAATTSQAIVDVGDPWLGP